MKLKNGQVCTSLDKIGQVWTSLDKFGQIRKYQVGLGKRTHITGRIISEGIF